MCTYKIYAVASISCKISPLNKIAFNVKWFFSHYLIFRGTVYSCNGAEQPTGVSQLFSSCIFKAKHSQQTPDCWRGKYCELTLVQILSYQTK